MTKKVFSFTVQPAAGIPAWFSTLPVLTWREIAKGTGGDYSGGATLSQSILASNYVWPTDGFDPLSPSLPVLGPQGGIMNSAAYCQNSNGMAVDPVRGYCYMVANGGHGGYMGNETMALNLRSDQPGWTRFVDSTPPWHISSVANGGSGFDSIEEDAQGTFAYLAFTDGPAWSVDYVANPTYTYANTEITRRPPASHTACLQTFSEGKVWFPLQNSTNFNGGCSSFSKLSVDVDAVHATPSLRNWRYGTIAPWQFYGINTDVLSLQPRGSQSLFLFPTAALDRETGRVWICPGTTSSMRYFWMLETRGVNAGKHQTFQTSPGMYLRTNNCVSGDITTGIVDGAGNPIKLFVLYGFRLQSKDVYVLDITAVEAANPSIPYTGVIEVDAWSNYVATDSLRWINSNQFAQGKDPTGAWGPQQAWGMVWHQPSKGFLLFNNDQAVGADRLRDGKIRKLALPLDGSGRYNPAGSWVYTSITTQGPIPGTLLPDSFGLGVGGSFSRFNIMRNFDGIGNDLLISVNADDKPVSVMKLPQAGV